MWRKGATSDQIVAGGVARGNGLHQFNVPTDVVVDKVTNSFVVCDSHNRRVMRWSRNVGIKAGKVIIDNIACFGVAQDTKGFLYVSDTEKNEVRRYSQGKLTMGTIVAGGHGKGTQSNQLNFPTSLFVDTEQSIYVSDWKNRRMMKWMKSATEGIIVRKEISKFKNDRRRFDKN